MSDDKMRPLRWWMILLATVFGLVVLGGAGYGLWRLARHQPDFSFADLARTAVIAVAAVGAVPAAYIAYRRQRTLEMQHEDERSKAARAVDEEFQDRYVDAANQMGSERPATRMAGIYAMARLADEWGVAKGDEYAQLCVDVLCAYLRIPYGPKPGSAQVDAEEREVRRTLIRIIRDHLRSESERGTGRWSHLSFSFQYAYFDHADLSKCHFAGPFVSFEGATFAGSWINFDDARFDTRAYFIDVAVHSKRLTFNDATLAPGGRNRFWFEARMQARRSRIECTESLKDDGRVRWRGVALQVN